MLWCTARDVTNEMRETELQAVFDEWDGDRAGWTTVGFPRWIERLGKPESRSRGVRGEAYGVPDVLWKEHNVVAELKRAAKYEPLGLAEVLHHAHWLSEGGHQFRSVLVTSYSPWLRSAISFLFANGLARDVLTHIEVCFVQMEDLRYLWAETPLAAWQLEHGVDTAHIVRDLPCLEGGVSFLDADSGVRLLLPRGATEVAARLPSVCAGFARDTVHKRYVRWVRNGDDWRFDVSDRAEP